MFADATILAVRTRLAHSIAWPMAEAPTSEVRQVPLNAEDAAQAAFAAAIDVRWRLGRSARPGATS